MPSGGRRRCPFHGFQFDCADICVDTPYADRLPPRVQLATGSVRVPALGAHRRLFVLPTPVDEENIELRIACMSLHSSRLLSRLFRTVVFRAFCQEVEEDIPIWSRKAYLPSPALATGDGPIASYRRWASQFYPSEQVTEEPLRVPLAR